MTEEIKNQIEEKNTVATVGMRFSISGLVAIIFIVLGIWCLFRGSLIGFFLLFIGIILGLLSCGYLNFLVGFILGIVGLFYKPRGKARVAVIIPLVVFIAIASVVCYIWNSVSTPAKEWYNWVQPNMEQLYSQENFDNDKFRGILQQEYNNISSSLSEDEFKIRIESSTGSNMLEKRAYFGFSLLQQVIENAIEKYNDGYVVEIIDDNENNIINLDVQVNNEEEKEEEETKTEREEVQKPEKRETFTQSEKEDIEQIINILE